MRLVKINAGYYRTPDGQYEVFRKWTDKGPWIIENRGFTRRFRTRVHETRTLKEARAWLSGRVSRLRSQL